MEHHLTKIVIVKGVIFTKCSSNVLIDGFNRQGLNFKILLDTIAKFSIDASVQPLHELLAALSRSERLLIN